MNYKTILFTLLFSITSIAFAQVPLRSYYTDGGLVPVEHSVDFKHLKLEVSFQPEEKKVIGKVEHQFVVLQKQVDTLRLDAKSMEINSVLWNGKEVEFENMSNDLIIRFPEILKWETEHTLTIDYVAQPKKGLYFIGWDDTTGRSRKQIWTQGQGIDNRHWIPMYDEKNDKVVSEILVEFDEKYKVLSNGEKLKEKKIKGGKKLWHYKISHPHPTYLIMLGIGDYAIEQRKSKSGVNMDLYYYPDQKEQLEPTYRFSKRMFDFFEKEIGVPYPWETYSQIPVQDFMYGAMENTTATIFGDFYLVDSRTYLDRNYVRVNAHELAHQWFGDMVTARSSAHHWLQESFATHYDMMYQKEAFGKDYFDWVRRNYNNQSLNASKSDLKPLAHSSAGTVRHYPKGAFVLEMLKYVVGRDQFNTAIKYYLEKHAYGNVDSKNLLVAFHESLGLSLNWFWEDWIYRGGEPEYKVSFEEYENEGVFLVEQVHEMNDLVDLFRMPIHFEVHYTDGSAEKKQVIIEKQFHRVSFDLDNNKKVAYVLFDPNNQVMKKVSFSKSTEMLLNQAESAEHMLDRYDAIVALTNRDFEGKSAYLLRRFMAEDFYGIKNEIIQHIVPQLDEKALELTKLALADEDSEVRKSIVENTVRVSEELEPEYRKLLQDSSYQVIEKTLELLAFYYPQNIEDYLALTEGVDGDRSNNVKVSRLKLKYAHSQDEKSLNELVDLTSNSYEFLSRVNAARALKELNVLNEQALANMLNATFSFNRRLSSPVSSVIDHFYEQKEYKKMIFDYVTNQEWSSDEFKKVSKYYLP